MKFLPEFKKYLFSQKIPSSKLTVKNYASDVIRFTRWFESKFGVFSPESISSQIITQFKASYNLAPRSMERNLSSLRKFFNFLKLEGYLSQSPFEQIVFHKETPVDPYKLNDFKNYLYVYNASRLTIKNYLMDVKGFLLWTKEVTGSQNAYDMKEKDILGRIDNPLIEEYKRRLNYSPRTINRKLSSLRKYLKWAQEEGLITQGVAVGQGVWQRGAHQSVVFEEKEARKANTDGRIVPQTRPQYSNFPPFRLLQKTVRGLAVLPELILISPLVIVARKIDFLGWKLRGKPIFDENKNRIKIKSLSKEIFAPLAISTSSLPFHRKLIFHLAHSRPNWYKKYHSYSFTHYLHLAILIVFTSAVGFGVYQSFSQTPQRSVLGTNLMSPPNPRVLSFQGKLTDVSGNPITGTTNLRFAIYDATTASGSALKWQEVDTVTPDSDGIFSVLLGKNSTMGQDLFANHVGLWLGVTVGQTAELTPRQQLATVAFAENSETLQGLPPITQTGAATSNVVLALDSSGNLTIGGVATPTFQATGGQFTLSGNTLALTTTAGTNADIIATPSGLGKIDLNKPIRNTSNNNNISTAKTAVEVDDLLAVLATSSGQSALTINQNSTGPLISASTSGTAKFTVDNSGSTTIAGGNFSQTGTGSFSTGTGAISLNGNTTISSGNNFTVTSGNTSLTSAAATSNALSLTDTSLTSGTGFNQTYTLNAGNGQTSTGQSINLTDSTTAGGGYTGLAVTITGSGNGSGNKYLLDLNPGNVNREIIVDSTGSLRPTQGVSTNTTSIGSASFYFKNGFFDQITANTIAGTVSGGSTSSTTWTLGSTQTGDVNEALIFQRNSGSGNATLQWNAGAGDLRYLTANYPLNTTYTVNNTSIGTTIDLLSAALTNNTTSGTQNLLSLTNTGTGTTTNGIYLNNTGTATNGIQLVGAWGTGILTNNNSINAGTGALTSGAITTSGNFSQTGSTTFSTGTGAVSLNGATTANTFSSSGATITGGTINGATIGATTPSTGAFTTLSASSTLTASNGLTLTTGALNLTGTSGSIGLTGFGTTSTTSTTASGNINTLADSSLNTNGANLLNLTFTNANSGATSTTTNGISITPTGTTNSNSNANTLNAINLPNVTTISNNTFNGVNFGTGYNNLINSANFVVTAAGAVTAVGVNSGSGLIQGTGGETVTGATNINATGTALTNIGNSTGALVLASGGTSSWTNTSGNLTLSTATSGTLALTSAAALNITAASASTATLASSSTTALNIQSGLLDFDTTNSRVGIGTTGPGAKIEVDTGSTTQIGQIIKAQASQTADLLQIQNSLASVIAKVDSLGNITGNTLTSTVSTGTAPLTVTSTTVVANLNAAAAQEPMPNLVLNSDFGRRNKWMTFMPENFTDTNGITVDQGGAASVSGNVLTGGTLSAGGYWTAHGGLGTWRDVRLSVMFQAANSINNDFKAGFSPNPSTFTLGNASRPDDSIYVANDAGNFKLIKSVGGGTATILSSVGNVLTLNNYYWLEIERQGTTLIGKIYSCGASACAKSSATLSQTLTGTLNSTDVVPSGYYWFGSNYASSKWGAASPSGDGWIYVEGWGPESWTVDHTVGQVRGGQAIGFDETADSGPLNKQWAVRVYIPPAGGGGYRDMTLTQTTPDGTIISGNSYTASSYSYTSGMTGGGAFPRFFFYTQTSAQATVDTNFDNGRQTSWTRATITATPSSTARRAQIQYEMNPNGNTSGTIFIDLPQLEQGSVATPWRNAPSDSTPSLWSLQRKNTADPSTTSGSAVEIDSRDYASNLFFPQDGVLTTQFSGEFSNSGDGNNSILYFYLDGALIGTRQRWAQQTANRSMTITITSIGFVSAGNHRLALLWSTGAGTTSLSMLSPAANDALIIAQFSPGKGGSNSGANDLAEEYSVADPTIEAGDVVRTSEFRGSLGSASVERTDKAYDSSAFGVVSTYPAITFGNYDPMNGKIIDTSKYRYIFGTDYRPVALSGRVPVKVTNENGTIHRGDILTSSATYQGYAMKATRAGRSIGVAMDDFSPINNSQVAISNELPNESNIQTGKIMTFVNLSWYDPDVYLTSTGDFVINKVQNTTQIASATPDPQTGLYPSPITSAAPSASATSSAQPTSEPIANCRIKTDSSNFGLVKSNCPQTVSVNYTYQIADSLGNVVQRVGAFSQIVVGTLKAGLVQTKDLVADTINVNNKIISPIAEVSQLKTDVITPLGSDKVVIRLQDNSATPSATSVPRLEVQNASGSAVVSITDKGDASLSGRLTAQSASISSNLSANSATISGTLKAKNIIADNIDTAILNLKSSISNLLPKNSTTSAVLKNLPETASLSAQLANVDTLQAQVGTFMSGLFAVGPTSLSDATVFGQLSVGENLILANGSINVLGSDLKLQPLGQGGILLGKKIEIDASGNLTTSANVTVGGTLFSDTVSPIPGNDLIFRLLIKNATGSAKFKVENASGSAVATIDSNGDASFRKLNLNLISPAFALSSTEVIATGSAGIATISAKQKEITIDNKLVTDKSLIYISPVGTPSAQTPFLLRQAPGESFTVGAQSSTDKGLPFNWLIIN